LSACESVSLTSNGSSTICGSAGVNRFFTAVATDACGNTSTAEVVVQVQDTTAPYLYVYNQDIVVECSASDSDIFNSVYFETADNCSDVSVSMEVVPVYDECGLLSDGSYVLVTATDACGNQTSAQVNVQQMDTAVPVIILPAQNAVFECDGTGNDSDIAAWIDNRGGAVVDDCCQVTWTHIIDSSTSTCGGTGSILATFVATDLAGNSTVTLASAQIVDSTPPTITDTGGLANGSAISVCGSVPPPIELTAVDMCSEVEVAFTESYMIADDFENGISYESYERTYTATDCAGNSTVFTYTVNILPDTDGDGLCNVDDPDDDNDGVIDGQDWSPFNPAECSDVDGDGCDDCNPLDESIDLFDEYNDGAWAVEQPIISFVGGSMLATGNNAMMRSQTMLTSLLQVEAQLVKDEDCDDHYLILTTDPNFTWDWDATTSGVIIGWNCSSAHLNGTGAGLCADAGTYNVSIDVGWSQFLVTTDCGTYTVPNPTGNLDFYIYVGADNDGGDAEWLDIRWTQLGEATFDPSTDGLDSDGDGLCDAGDSAPLPGDCGNPVGYQGYDYATVQIGNQCWFAENLRNENYANGDAIPSNLSDSEWQNTTSGAVAVYGDEDSGCGNSSQDIDACDPAQSLIAYGRLYNWYSVDDARGLCPSGWHVPTDGEWTVTTVYLGGSSVAGGYMKADFGWYNGGNGTNSSGFSGLPGGYRDYSGYFISGGYNGAWWSSSPNGSEAWSRFMYSSYELVGHFSGDKRLGFSVRCVQNAE